MGDGRLRAESEERSCILNEGTRPERGSREEIVATLKLPLDVPILRRSKHSRAWVKFIGNTGDVVGLDIDRAGGIARATGVYGIDKKDGPLTLGFSIDAVAFASFSLACSFCCHS